MKKIQRQNSRTMRTLPITKNQGSLPMIGLPPICVQSFSLADLLRHDSSNSNSYLRQNSIDDSLQLTESSAYVDDILNLEDCEEYGTLRQLIEDDEANGIDLVFQPVQRKYQRLFY
ncbi:hypothetical protein SS50377_26262 [Spironucleus salmonicida]|uniref:Uncharacterized protein n=1 Tax=Spironucleus salmonicida TaxID=348837 RepID=V6LIE8_9EUKA|nr:hypothetical protein SS50377_26262 [Spironucleus salmonicida]|eukprot:EST44360.1 Hypothetical protein SS50377_15789 [Spironucleus salmonicida]